MAAQRQDSGQPTNFTASRAEPDQTSRRNSNLLNLGVFDDDPRLLQEEFCRLLEKSGFVEEVIDFYISNERRLLTQTTSGADSHHHSQRHNTGEWEQLVKRRLPDWLFWLTYILTAQAKLVEENRQMSRAQLAALLNDRLFRQTSDDRLFRAHRRRLWTPALLRKVVHEALKYINTPGRVTLENLAMNITFLSRRDSSPIKLLKPLSGKHLQKLLRQNDIKWIEIKRRYVARLILLR